MHDWHCQIDDRIALFLIDAKFTGCIVPTNGIRPRNHIRQDLLGCIAPIQIHFDLGIDHARSNRKRIDVWNIAIYRIFRLIENTMGLGHRSRNHAQ